MRRVERTPLMVLAPMVGAPSESFVRRHMCDLLPGRTFVVVGRNANNPTWRVNGPVLFLPQLARRPRPLIRRIVNRLGVRVGHGHERELVRECRRRGVEVALLEWLDVAVRWMPALLDAGIRVVAHAHGYDVSARQLERCCEPYKVLRQASSVVTVSNLSRSRLIGQLDLPAERVSVIPCGVEISGSKAPRSGKGPVRFVAVGRLVAKKAPILLLEAFRRALNSEFSMELDIVGDGPLMPAVQHYISAHRLDCVRLHGAQSHQVVMALMGRAAAFVQHSVTDPITGDEEGLPVAILEAMALGLPVISTWHAGIPDAVVHDQTGLLVEEGDVDGMARAIGMVAADKDLRARLGDAGWGRVRDQFSWIQERERLLDVLCLPVPPSLTEAS